jgi:hypothetical protein
MRPTNKAYYIVSLPDITGTKDYTPIYSEPIDTYSQMIEASRLTKVEHYVIYWDGYREYVVRA